MKIITIVGARPQFIKSSVISNLIKENNDIEEVIIHTGQHFDEMMSDIFFKDLDIPEPKYNLGISNLSHGSMTGRMIEEIEKILIKEKPDLVLVYGDTNSTLAGSISSSKLNIPIAHIEAGLRSLNMNMPEEINRKLTDHVSSFLFCPTIESCKNLEKENIVNNINFVGDLMYDSFLKYEKYESNILNKLSLKSKDFCLLTLHRQENTKDINDLMNLFTTLRLISQNFGYKFVFPIHPRTEKLLKENNFKFNEFKNLLFINPVSYIDMIKLEKNSKIILTDSGGVQKESYWAKVPCITLRNETEWNELLKTGMNVLTGLNYEKIYNKFYDFIFMKKTNFDLELYGDGKSGQKILEILCAKK